MGIGGPCLVLVGKESAHFRKEWDIYLGWRSFFFELHEKGDDQPLELSQEDRFT